ncbi:MAG: methionine--tRNA ligase subunit beta [Candidatus Omnitrophica bacterium]|nr:methionine--tRNA ligase subunit beta [Candidatus Omnitrophota bacterium]MCA9403736.1 methionine--tRNA ligase subunit beta [Candidatus Omnitrophota bacterium]
MATIQDFMNLELKVARIIEAKEHPNADRLFVLKIDLGSEERQLVAGIRSSYQAEELVGKKIVVIANLEPATIRGEESQGMLLAASGENGPVLLAPEKDVPLGSQVK